MNTKFLIHRHDAKRAGLHFDIRLKISSNKWMSFAVPKGVPTEFGKKVLAIRTHDHTDKEAKTLGIIDDGYGAGELKLFDSGNCIIHKNTVSHIAIEFKGNKIKGLYHMVNVANMTRDRTKYKQQQYFLFKSKNQL